MSDIEILTKVRDQVAQQIDRYFAAEVSAADTAQIGYAGLSVAFVTYVKHNLESARN